MPARSSTGDLPKRAARATVPGHMPERAQLTLPLGDDDALPALAMPADWKEQPRSFGHAFHPLCTYLGGLPPAMAHALVERFSRPGDVVLDPFCGRGTVPLQATLRRRVGVGVDLNPLAALLTGAVLDAPSHREAQDRLARLRIDWTIDQDRWRDEALELQSASAVAPSLFHAETLAELLHLRRALDRRDPVDRFLLATARRHPPRLPPVPPDRRDAQRVQHGAAVHPGMARTTGHGPPTARRLHAPRRSGCGVSTGMGCPWRAASPSRVTRGTRRGAGVGRAASACPARPCPPRRHQPAIPARRALWPRELAPPVAAGRGCRSRRCRPHRARLGGGVGCAAAERPGGPRAHPRARCHRGAGAG